MSYDLIEEKVLGSATASVTFSSIPGTYKDLVLEVFAVGTAGTYYTLGVNGDTGTNYSRTFLNGNGSSASSGRTSNSAPIGTGDVTTTLGATYTKIDFMSYSNTNVNKTWIIRANYPASYTEATVTLWRNTAALTSIVLTMNTSTFAANSVFRLWGVSG